MSPQEYNTTLTESDKVWNKGFDGSDYVVAILDTGVDPKHPMLAGKLVSEACYSATKTVKGVKHFSLCPGHAASSTAKGSGKFCDLSVAGCSHGTDVASIAVGHSAQLDGVAKGAKFISIQIYSKQMTGCRGKSPCATSFTSDQVAGLERVFSLRNKYQIAAANMSVGTYRVFTSSCDDKEPTLSAIIEKLRTKANIATVIAAGNSRSATGISDPACISSAIS